MRLSISGNVKEGGFPPPPPPSFPFFSSFFNEEVGGDRWGRGEQDQGYNSIHKSMDG